ncbi:MAG TPA: hypothetical protein VI141_08150 [Acidimicrobiia bacterium]
MTVGVDAVVAGDEVVGVVGLDVDVDVDVDVDGAVVVVVGSEVEVGVAVGATASGAPPTRESAMLTICQVRNVVTTTAATQPTTTFHDIPPLSQQVSLYFSIGPQASLKEADAMQRRL